MLIIFKNNIVEKNLYVISLSTLKYAWLPGAVPRVFRLRLLIRLPIIFLTSVVSSKKAQLPTP